MEVLLLSAVIGGGMFLNKNYKRPKKVKQRNAVIPNDIPNGTNVYSSNMANEADYAVLKKGTKNYLDSQNPKITGVLPPIFNTYGVNGSQQTLDGQGATGYPLNTLTGQQMNQFNEINRRANPYQTAFDGTGAGSGAAGPGVRGTVVGAIPGGMPGEANGIGSMPMFQRVSFGIEAGLSPFGSTANDLAGIPFNANVSPAQQQLNPLTGLPYETAHANQVPFFGGSVKQNIEPLTNITTLDLFTGNTDTYRHKKETTPFYTLQQQDIHGTPSVTENTDMDRFIPSNFKQGEKPFYEERVAAPIAGTIHNEIRAYGTSVDDLRYASHPKLSFEGRTNSGQFMNVRGVNGAFNKNLPDTFYTAGDDMWFKTTGLVKADAARDNYSMKPTSRQDTTDNYIVGPGYNSTSLQTQQRTVLAGCGGGNGGGVSGAVRSQFDLNINPGYHVEHFGNHSGKNCDQSGATVVQQPTRQSFQGDPFRNVGTAFRQSNDYGKSGYTPYTTERGIDAVFHQDQFGVNVGDPSRGGFVPFGDEARNTMKQTTLNGDFSGNIHSNFGLNSMNAVQSDLQHWDAKTTNKEVLVNGDYNGGAIRRDLAGMGYEMTHYDARTTGKEILSAIQGPQGNAERSRQNAQVYSTYDNPIKTRNIASAELSGSAAPVVRIDPTDYTTYDNPIKTRNVTSVEYSGSSAPVVRVDPTDYTTYDNPIKTRNVTSVEYSGSSAPVVRVDPMEYTTYDNPIKTRNVTSVEYSGSSAPVVRVDPTDYTTYDNPIKTRNVTSVEYSGSANPAAHAQTESRTNYLNAEINDRQEQLLLGNRPGGQQYFQIQAGADLQGTFKYTDRMALKEEVSPRNVQDVNEFLNPRLPKLTTPIGGMGVYQNKKETESEIENSRITPEYIVNQLHGNPFFVNTQGLI